MGVRSAGDMKVETSAWQVVPVAGSSGPAGRAEDAGTRGRLAGSRAGRQGAGRAALTPPAPQEKYYTALVNGDLKSLEVLTDRYYKDVNLVFEISKNEMEWQVKSQSSYGLSGLWSLEYKQELTTPLCIAASRGHAACLRHLLLRRADPDLAPGGRAPLHEACRGGHTACVELLLEHKADPNLRSDEGLAPLHLCTTRDSLGCAKLLLRHGAAVNLPSEEAGETALHVAARHGLYDHAHLYLRHGARVDARSVREETAMGVLCSHAPGTTGSDDDDLLRLCRLLAAHGADLDARDEGHRSPLHKACRAANSTLARFLLRRGADVNAIDYDGLSPLGCALQAAAFRRERRPHQAVQLLLNHGSQKIWPPAFAKVLKSCAAVPEIIEVLINSYSQIPVSEKWAEVVPEEVMQQHRLFYESFFRLSGTVRCLQHLCRFAIRKKFGNKCHCLIPLLPVPKPLHDYLLLEPEGVVF
ncbi:LOW QUALITY PROTEIN: ankyrin repeat and SOCS box protein 18 [Cygnus atratus]|uniref:LOW QUALITY PROTEIN: ankyrin repeat and SOCS box protein 18 n=1 Tax=Cygnus atratus TaxID=8868 RepID=UPI0015D5C565|nr:LOW QUALITY PROTEIN: ankyrin repeat and SOCS box protein 18 [Cygnus atratus]